MIPNLERQESYGDPDEASDIEEEPPEPNVQVVQKIELTAGDFYFGSMLGEGAYARVIHAKSKKTSAQFAVKIMDKVHIKKENKVRFIMFLSNAIIIVLLRSSM